MSILNDRIKSRRLDLGLTLLQIADKLAVKEATVQRYESGEIKNMKYETIVQLSNILKCSPSYLMGWTDDMQMEKPSGNRELSEGEIEMLKLFSLVPAERRGELLRLIESALKMQGLL